MKTMLLHSMRQSQTTNDPSYRNTFKSEIILHDEKEAIDHTKCQDMGKLQEIEE